MKFLSGTLGFIVIFLALAFALANRQTATISLWPFGITIEAPLYLLTLGTLLLGVVIGAFIAWFGMFPHRLRARKAQKDLAVLQDKVADLQQAVAAAASAPDPDDDLLLPGPPKKRFWGRS
jgi:uncharacterized integral membrane protein